MRIEKSETFSPVSIILESQDEVNFMHGLTRHISGLGDIRDFFDRIGDGLCSISTIDHTDTESHFSGNLRVTD